MDDESKLEREKLDLDKSIHALEREKFEFEKSMRERELTLKQNEAGIGAKMVSMVATMMPLFVVLVASYFAYRQFVQTQKDTADAQTIAALYAAATEQYKAVLAAKTDLIKRKDTNLDTVAANVKTIRLFIDGPEFVNNDAYKSAKRQFYGIESSVIPFVRTPELTEAVGLFERGMVRSEHIARKNGATEAYDILNTDWKTLQKHLDAHATVLELPQDFADMMGALATGVAEAIEQAHIKNVDPDQFGTVKEIFDRASAPARSSP
jgi:hypothetical protein